jgi:hypothetical protein
MDAESAGTSPQAWLAFADFDVAFCCSSRDVVVPKPLPRRITTAA